MNKTSTVQARIDPNLKKQVDTILHQIGLNASQAVNAFYAQIVLQKGMPFELKIPNQKTLKAMNELDKGDGDTFTSFDDMIQDAK